MKTTILFETTEAAFGAAYILRGEWDGLNSVIVENLDSTTLSFAADQLQSTCCTIKAVCHLQKLGLPEEFVKKYSRDYPLDLGKTLPIFVVNDRQNRSLGALPGLSRNVCHARRKRV